MMNQCRECGNALAVLRRPLRRLRWTRYWWRGVASLVTRPLRVCPRCGAIYTHGGRFLAAGAAETNAEMRLRGFRNDMANLRDGFATVVLAGEVGVVWTLMAPAAYDLGASLIIGAVGGVALIPFAYFARKTRTAQRELKRLRSARRKGEIVE